jgi:hypothetical protein
MSDSGADVNRRPYGDFIGEVDCVCGFMLDQYDDGRFTIEYADPDTDLMVRRCPDCGRDLSLLGQKR